MQNVALFMVGLGAGVGAVALVLAIRSALTDDPGPPSSASSALRCSLCGTDWPPHVHDYGRCPACLEPTAPIRGSGVQPLDPGEARSIRLHLEFDRFYAARRGETAA
ncbi:MAG TPA: hypothetical protein VMA77_22275 [Solirubrobacteraceae bacterium]|nr:hypothetical protein [Solirubrobacteraceae bacterium]